MHLLMYHLSQVSDSDQNYDDYFETVYYHSLVSKLFQRMVKWILNNALQTIDCAVFKKVIFSVLYVINGDTFFEEYEQNATVKYLYQYE